MKRICILLAVILSGCASSDSPAPNFINGHYYMAGDSNCYRARPLVPAGIECLNKQNEATGYRQPMTDQELMMYQHSVNQQQGNVQVNNGMPVVRYPQMSTPQVTPITPSGGNQVRCLSAGIYTNCRY